MTAAMVAALQGSLDKFMVAEGQIVAFATRSGVAETTGDVQLQVRDRVTRAFPGGKRQKSGTARVANAIRKQLYHDGPGEDAGLVYSKFGRGRGSGFVDYLLPHVRGATIKPERSERLLVPLTSNRRSIKRRKRVDFIPLGGGAFLLTSRRTKRRPIGQALALLLPRVKLKPRLALADLPIKATRQLADTVADALAKGRAGGLAGVSGLRRGVR